MGIKTHNGRLHFRHHTAVLVCSKALLFWQLFLWLFFSWVNPLGAGLGGASLHQTRISLPSPHISAHLPLLSLGEPWLWVITFCCVSVKHGLGAEKCRGGRSIAPQTLKGFSTPRPVPRPSGGDWSVREHAVTGDLFDPAVIRCYRRYFWQKQWEKKKRP